MFCRETASSAVPPWRERSDGCDPDTAGQAIARRPHLLGIVRRRRDALRPISTCSPSGVSPWKREPRSTSITPSWPSSCLIPAERRLGEAALLRRPAKMLFLGERDEEFQLVDHGPGNLSDRSAQGRGNCPAPQAACCNRPHSSFSRLTVSPSAMLCQEQGSGATEEIGHAWLVSCSSAPRRSASSTCSSGIPAPRCRRRGAAEPARRRRGRRAAIASKIVELEQQADEITREVMLAVRKSFITPFDRGDIKDLIQSMDDAIDMMHKTVKTITLFEQKELRPAHAGNGRGHRRGGAGSWPRPCRCSKSSAPTSRGSPRSPKRSPRSRSAPTSCTTQGLKDLFQHHGQTDAMA